MQQLRHERMNESLYYEKLDNGLAVYVLPKPGFQKTYATFTTRYGSVDNRFRIGDGPVHRVPDGIAHFLEHKMFEEPTGDIFATFASNGASANAFTSFDRTAYLFSATSHIEDNLNTLIDFVQNPYFTDENVEKEKGIIGQEINMYRDHPDWRSYYGLIEALYQVHPIHIDIAGTVQSIAEITKETLYECYHTFYHPDNMMLFIVGGVDAAQMFELVKRNQAKKRFEPHGPIERLFEEEPEGVRQKETQIALPVSLPKWLLGFKESKPGVDGKPLLKRELATKVMLDALVGPSSALYQRLYDEGLISDGFGQEYNVAPDYAFAIIGGDTKDPQQLHARIRERIEELKKTGMDAADFERSRKKRLGGYLRMLNSPEAITNEFTKYRFKGIDFFELATVYEELELKDVNERLHALFDWDRSAVSIVERP